jgi:hypothetical protein
MAGHVDRRRAHLVRHLANAQGQNDDMVLIKTVFKEKMLMTRMVICWERRLCCARVLKVCRHLAVTPPMECTVLHPARYAP